MNSTEKELTTLLEKLCEMYGVTVKEIRGLSRDKKFVDVRQAFSLIADYRGYGPSEISRFLNINHSSVIHYCETRPLGTREQRIVDSMTNPDTMISRTAKKLTDDPGDPLLQMQMLKLLLNYDIEYN